MLINSRPQFYSISIPPLNGDFFTKISIRPPVFSARRANGGNATAKFRVNQWLLYEMLTSKIIGCAMKVHRTLNYLEAYKMPIGLLINFGSTELEFKRVHIEKPIPRNRENR